MSGQQDPNAWQRMQQWMRQRQASGQRPSGPPQGPQRGQGGGHQQQQQQQYMATYAGRGRNMSEENRRQFARMGLANNPTARFQDPQRHWQDVQPEDYRHSAQQELQEWSETGSVSGQPGGGRGQQPTRAQLQEMSGPLQRLQSLQYPTPPPSGRTSPASGGSSTRADFGGPPGWGGHHLDDGEGDDDDEY